MNLNDDQARIIDRARNLAAPQYPDVAAILSSSEMKPDAEYAMNVGYALGIVYANLQQVLRVVGQLTGK